MEPTPAIQAFNDQLLRCSQELETGARSEVEKKLWEEYGAETTVLIVDMSGFTKLTDSHGVVHYLSMVRRMQLTAEPIVKSYGGSIVKFEADSAFARFENPANAIRATIALNLALDSANLLTPDELDIYISAGIDHGKCLFPHPHDFFGSPVNRASKLGEDIGKPGQILVTKTAMQMVPDNLAIKANPVSVEFGGKKEQGLSVQFK